MKVVDSLLVVLFLVFCPLYWCWKVGSGGGCWCNWNTVSALLLFWPWILNLIRTMDQEQDLSLTMGVTVESLSTSTFLGLLRLFVVSSFEQWSPSPFPTTSDEITQGVGQLDINSTARTAQKPEKQRGRPRKPISKEESQRRQRQSSHYGPNIQMIRWKPISFPSILLLHNLSLSFNISELFWPTTEMYT